MNEKDGHSIAILLDEPPVQKVLQGDGVGSEAESQHDSVGRDGNDVPLPELHVIRQRKVCPNHHFSCIKSLFLNYMSPCKPLNPWKLESSWKVLEPYKSS